MLMSNSMRTSNLTFKGGNKPNSKDVKKVFETVKKVVGAMKEKAQPEKKRGDNLLKSPLFNKLLNVVDFETVVTATIAAIACAFRGFTILGMSKKSDEQSKGNNTYAVSHAWASGIVGFISTFIFTVPFKAGADHVLKKNFKNLKESVLKRLHPQLDLASIVDKSGKRIDSKLWKNMDGLEFCDNIKNCDMLPKFKQLADMSIETFEKILNVKNIDWAAQKGVSFNEIVAKDGKTKLYDLIDFKNLGITVKHVEKSAKSGKTIESKGQILFKDMTKEYLEDLIKNADNESMFKNLDINSVFKDGKMVDFRNWKTTAGEQWKMDLDKISASSVLETADYMPRITGKLRFDEKEGIHKFKTYQRNGVNGGLGTEISDEMLKAEKESAGLIKSLTWAPDLLFRIPIALTTVSLIPWVLKTMFGVEKHKKPEADNSSTAAKTAVAAATAAAATVAVAAATKGSSAQPISTPATVSFNGIENNKVSFKGRANQSQQDNVLFKGGKPPKKPNALNKFVSYIGETMGNLYGRPLIESEGMAKVSAKLSDMPGGLTQGMQTVGSLLTSSAYVYGTVTNKKLDPEKRKTLGINQVLCFIVPTIAAYTVDKLLNNWIKSKEYRYSGLQQQAAADAKLNGNLAKSKEIIESLGNKVKGVRVLASLAVFTIIYRYATPVLITPIANKIGDKINANKQRKREEQAKLATASN